MLYRPEDFEPLVDEPWDAARIRDGIREIVEDTDGALRGPRLLWPAEAWDRWRATSPLKDLYCGAAGVLWALAELRDRGHPQTALDLGELALCVLERQRARPDLGSWTDLPEPRESALLAGETGILLVAYRVGPSAELAETLHARVRENIHNEADEIMWGAPGTLIAAQRMLGWTGKPRWRAAWDESADAVLARRDSDGQWTQRLHGHATRYLGPVHGLVGNIQALVTLLDGKRRSALVRRTSMILERAAVVQDDLATWPPEAGARLENTRGEIRLQWCHGAPGIICSTAPYLDEALVVAGAELTWVAGAHRDTKGAGICHGTAGNGYALIKAFERTGDERWLTRARAFAMHAAGQVARSRAEHGHGRFTLWTGDLGTALYLADCIEGVGYLPLP